MYPYAILVFLCLFIPGFGKIPPPTNVRMDSVNLKNILRWNPPPGFEEDEDIRYHVQFRLDFRNPGEYQNCCLTQHLNCDLTVITYKFNATVTALVGDKQSDPVVIHFDPYAETVIGPPEVLVSSRSGHMDISFSGPYFESDSTKDSIKAKYGELLYRVFYWKKEDPSHVLSVNTSQSTGTLTKLETWTIYCLKVQAYISSFGKEGLFSPEICRKTTDDGRTPWWQIAGMFLATMLFTMSATLGLCYFGFTARRKYLSFPSYSIPEHLKEYLSKPFSSSPNLPTQPSEEYGESCEQLTFISVESEEETNGEMEKNGEKLQN
ncbi:interleukin-10 receptor subunit beta [Pyxicephalus adspersus]|uniref:interleukin-10 receptor subunit beta n=1 Tax=Pyxicephalus adspersus TaxID=30357 RepID=UPI003B595668